LFKSKKGKEQLHEIEKRAKTFVPGEPLPAAGGAPARPVVNPGGLTPQQVRNIKLQIAKASTLEEIERLSHMLRTGQAADGATNGAAKTAAANVEEMDED